jgi:hypothetical protein
VRRAAAAALALALLLGGCGSGSQNTSRAGVARYVAAVNATERQLSAPLADVTRTIVAYSQAARSKRGVAAAAPPAAEAQSLLRDGAQIDNLRGRLAALPAPAPARQLRAQLVELVDRQATLTRQMAKLVRFLPGFSLAMAPLGPALLRLERVLSISQAQGSAAVAQVYAEKAAALLDFRGVAVGILQALRSLDPPTVSVPPYRAQVRAVGTMVSTAGALARALSAGSAAQARPLLIAFSQAAAGPSSVAAQRARIAAIRAYDARLRSLNRLAEQASRERLRLSKTLG